MPIRGILRRSWGAHPNPDAPSPKLPERVGPFKIYVNSNVEGTLFDRRRMRSGGGMKSASTFGQTILRNDASRVYRFFKNVNSRMFEEELDRELGEGAYRNFTHAGENLSPKEQNAYQAHREAVLGSKSWEKHQERHELLGQAVANRHPIRMLAGNGVVTTVFPHDHTGPQSIMDLMQPLLTKLKNPFDSEAYNIFRMQDGRLIGMKRAHWAKVTEDLSMIPNVSGIYFDPERGHEPRPVTEHEAKRLGLESVDMEKLPLYDIEAMRKHGRAYLSDLTDTLAASRPTWREWILNKNVRRSYRSTKKRAEVAGKAVRRIESEQAELPKWPAYAQEISRPLWKNIMVPSLSGSEYYQTRWGAFKMPFFFKAAPLRSIKDQFRR